MQEALKKVQAKLQKAVELELATLPPYLTAVFSMHSDANRVAATTIRSVYMEEMLHFILAANVLIATGGKVSLGKDNIPSYPLKMEFEGKGFRDREFYINLSAFTKDAVDIFRQIELPDWKQQAKALERSATFEVEGYTIGDFYKGIQNDLRLLCKAYSEEDVFSGDINRQVTEDYYWGGGGKPIVVHNLNTAINALEEIIEQGEGADGTKFDGDHLKYSQSVEYAHYFRFNEIYNEQYYKADDPVQGDPTGDPFPVDYTKVYPIKSNCKSTDFKYDPQLTALNHEFNFKYTMMLHQLEEGFNSNPKVLYTAIMNSMHDLVPIASKMVQIPIKGDPDGLHGAPSFEWVDIKKLDDNG